MGSCGYDKLIFGEWNSRLLREACLRQRMGQRIGFAAAARSLPAQRMEFAAVVRSLPAQADLRGATSGGWFCQAASNLFDV
ncbi:MAG: hypothetical protein FJ010_00135 [Chloroflexi bacterium]|nr:hypothetical protein [Chloroflexota bacterium]